LWLEGTLWPKLFDKTSNISIMMIFESDETAQNNPTTKSTDDFPQRFD